MPEQLPDEPEVAADIAGFAHPADEAICTVEVTRSGHRGTGTSGCKRLFYARQPIVRRNGVRVDPGNRIPGRGVVSTAVVDEDISLMAIPIATGCCASRGVTRVAVVIVAVSNLVGAFLSTEVAKTISGGLIREGADGIQITPTMIFAGLISAIRWNLATWLGLPSSSSVVSSERLSSSLGHPWLACAHSSRLLRSGSGCMTAGLATVSIGSGSGRLAITDAMRLVCRVRGGRPVRRVSGHPRIRLTTRVRTYGTEILPANRR